VSLTAFKGTIPFEYVDGLAMQDSNVQSNTGYTITHCSYLYRA
jgi:hypothetical protein